MELRRYWEIICRRKWIIIITFLIFFATVVTGTNIVTPTYEAKAKMLIKSSDSLSSLMSSLGLTIQSNRDSSSDDGTYDTDIALATIRPLLDKLISELDLKDGDGEILSPEDLIKSSILNNISPHPYIEVEQYEDSDILEIISKSTNPAEAAKMSNELAELYIENRLNFARKEYKAAHVFLENQIKDVKEKYYKSLLEKRDFMIKEATVDLETETRNLLSSISDLKNDYKNNEIDITQAKESITLIEKKIGGKEYVSSNLVNYIESKVSDLLVELAGKSIDITGQHPDVIQLNRQVDILRQYLKDKTELVLNESEVSIAPIYEELIRSLKDAYIDRKIKEIKRDLINKFIEEAQADLMKIPLKNIRQSEIALLVSVNQDVYKKLLEYLTQVSVAESMTLSNIRLIEPAVEPDIDEPAFPRKDLNYALGIFMGLFWGIFIAFFTEYIDDTVKALEDLKNYGFAFLGSVPKIKGKPMVSKMDPNDPVYESYRKILSNIHFVSFDKPLRKLMISSISPKDGSATTAANLGIIYAREGKKVLLVDVDLRRPNIHNLFDITNTKGLTDLLLSEAEMEQVISKSGVDGLSVLTTGSTPSDTGLLINSNKMQEIVRKLEEQYDVLLFHCAPLLIKSDAILLMKYLDNMAIVIRNKKTTHHDIIKVNESLKNANIVPMGMVFLST